jgi:hypothetical protein
MSLLLLWDFAAHCAAAELSLPYADAALMQIMAVKLLNPYIPHTF